jgi:hypothetical protein
MAIDHCILIIGAMKCGTTSLYQFLQRHPEIASSPMKEPRFFSDDECFVRGRAWYESLYPEADRRKWILDGSTDCAKFPFCGDVPARLEAFGGHFRLIYIMRNPLRRMESHARHAQLFRTEVNEVRSSRRDHGLDHGVSEISIAVSDYAAQIDRFRRYYDRGEMLLLVSEELQRDPKPVIDRIFDFLSLERRSDVSPPGYQNRAGELSELTPWGRLLRCNPLVNRALRPILPAPLRAWGRRPIEVPGRFTLTASEEAMLLERLKPGLVRLRDSYGIDAGRHWNIPLP